MEKAGIKLYVDLDKVTATGEYYLSMKQQIENWGIEHGLLKNEVNSNSSGVSTEAFVLTPEGMDDEKFAVLYNKVLDMYTDLEQAGLDIKALLNRVEEFYEILGGEEFLGGVDYLNQGEPSEKVAFLDTSYQPGIVSSSTLIYVQTAREQIALESCCDLLAGLKKVSVAYGEDKSTIEESMKKQKYVGPLCGAYTQYVSAVGVFNEDMSTAFAAISEDEYTPVTSRTYDFDEMSINRCSPIILTNLLLIKEKLEHIVIKYKDICSLNETVLLTLLLMHFSGNGDKADKLLNYYGESIKKKVMDELNEIVIGMQNKNIVALYSILSCVRDNVGLGILYKEIINADKISNNYKNNVVKLKQVYTVGSFIENQALWYNIYYGESTMMNGGCGVIATANALISLNNKLDYDDMAKLISYFENSGICINGYAGTSPLAIYDYFTSNGYDAAYTTEIEDLTLLSNNYTTFIVTAFNNADDIEEGMHTVCITRNEEGDYVIHNSYVFSDNKYSTSEAYSSLEEAVNYVNKSGNAKSVIVIGVKEELKGDFPEKEDKLC